MMEGRKWEELPKDCLVDIFGRVELKSLILGIPFVCKSWYEAVLNPFCWKHLDFPFLYGPGGEIRKIKLVKGVVDRSAGCATYVRLPSCYGAQQLSYVADKCPALRMLVRHAPDLPTMLSLSSVIGKFKNLEMLRIWVGCGSHLKDIVTQIGLHCQNFIALGIISVRLYKHACIGKDDVMTIVSCLPKLTALTLKGVRIERVNLIKLLKGCVALKRLDVRDCYGFDEYDKQLLKLASHIPMFKSSGSAYYDPDDPVDIDPYFHYGYFD